jgi:hypothetical protein
MCTAKCLSIAAQNWQRRELFVVPTTFCDKTAQAPRNGARKWVRAAPAQPGSATAAAADAAAGSVTEKRRVYSP